MEELERSLAELQDYNIDLMEEAMGDCTEEDAEKLLVTCSNAMAILAAKATTAIRDGDGDTLMVSLICISTCIGTITAALGLNSIDYMSRPEIDKRVDEVLDALLKV